MGSLFVGPAYTLANVKASWQDSINLFLRPIETADKAQFILSSVPGYTLFATLGGPVRGMLTTKDKTFVAAGSAIYQLLENGQAVPVGHLLTSERPVEMDWGINQLVAVDGDHGYVVNLNSGQFDRITSDAFYGSDSVLFLDNIFFFNRPGTGQIYSTDINNALSLDALDFATAESSPDDLVTLMKFNGRALLLGQLTAEVWFPSPNGADFILQKEGTTINFGCIAAHSVRMVDSQPFWIGRDENGAGMVFKLQGYQTSRVSTQAVEKALTESTDLTQATAYAYQDGGSTFYCINAPGLDATWCYELATQAWHKRCDLDSHGRFKADRGVCHTYAFGKHLIGGSDGKVYALDKGVYTKAGDPLVRERTSPHAVSPALMPIFFTRFTLDTSTGEAAQGIDPQAELSWFDWHKGSTWSNPVLRSIGRAGERFARVVWTKLGRSIDRVWRVRFSGNAPFSIINVSIQAEEGK